jgi:hypothetical protein
VLPFAAIARSRALRIAAVALTAWLLLTWFPQASLLMHDLGLRPGEVGAGLVNHDLIRYYLH